MPQLDLTSFLTQYTWLLITLFILFSILVSLILPKIQQQLAVRSKPFPGVFTPDSSTQFEIFKRLYSLTLNPLKGVLHKRETQC